jgi:hypothetical protein
MELISQPYRILMWWAVCREVKVFRGGNMHNYRSTALTLGILVFVSAISVPSYGADARKSVVLTLTDGHRQTFSLADVSSIEFKDAAIVVFKDGHQRSFSLAEVARIEFSPLGGNDPQFGRNHFLGKWEVGDGAGSKFFITLESDGQARKTLGASHGNWIVVDGEARISWDDGWHDVIRKAGTKHEKVAFAPGKSFSDDPDNVTNARNTSPEPI